MIGCGGLKRKECSIEERIGEYKEDVIGKTCRSTSEIIMYTRMYKYCTSVNQYCPWLIVTGVLSICSTYTLNNL